MGSPLWAQSSGHPWSAAGSLWSWAVSRLHLDWTARFFREDEETLVLTLKDELSQSYGEDTRLSSSTNPFIDECKRNPASSRQNSLALTQKDDFSLGEKPDPITRSASGVTQNSSAFKDTNVICTGTNTVTMTSAVSTADYLWYKTSSSYDKEINMSEANVEKNDESQKHKNMKESCRLARSPRGGVFKLRVYEDADEKTASELSSKSSKEQVNTSVAAPVQSPSTSLTDPNLAPTITAWEAGWNVTNAIQGIFVLGLPFALVQSGYMGLVLLVLSAWVCNHTGRSLVACLYEESQSGGSGSVSNVRVRNSYQDVMEACCKGLWPNWVGVGGWMVNIAQVVELLMTCTLYLLVSTSLLCDCLSGVALPRSVCSLVSLTFLLPCLLLTDLRPVSTLSLLCSLAHIVISLLVLLYCLSCASSWSLSSLSLSVDPEDFVVSVGVIIFSYTSQIFLPPLEGSMEDKKQFNAMLGWTHGAACIMKTLFSLLAVLTWGSNTSEVITDNLPSNLRPLVNVCLLAKALLSYPLPFYAAAEILQTCLLKDAAVLFYSKDRGVSHAALMVRGALLVTSYILALLVPRFSLLMGLTGSVTGAAMTLILPCLFHLRLKWGQLSVRDRLIDVGILSMGIICSISGVICSVKRLVEGL